jgi:hypothetical protein
MTPYDDLAAKARAALTEEAQLTADGYGAEALTMMLRSQRRDLATGVLALLADLRAARVRVERMERVVRLAHEATRALWESYHDGGWEMIHHEDDAGRDCPEDDTCECGGRLAAELLSKLDVEAKRALDALETP